MSRRRQPDAEPPLGSEGLPLPNTSASDGSNGKHRTSTDRLLRFLRTRPITSILILLTVLFTSFLTFHIGRSVGTSFLSFFQTFPHSAPPPLAHARVNDETGTLVDGAADGDQGKHESAQGLRSQGDVVNGTRCVRKFEPGKLGSEKTLCVTDEFYFDIEMGSQPLGRMKIGVFGQVVPKSAANFRALATCTGAFADEKTCYKGDSFHRVVTNFVAQGGSKATGRSIYGPTFREEREPKHHSFLQHAERGVVAWAEYPIGSQFYILIRDEAKYLDNNHVVFAIVTDGMDVLNKIHDAPRVKEEPLQRITIADCGDVHKA